MLLEQKAKGLSMHPRDRIFKEIFAFPFIGSVKGEHDIFDYLIYDYKDEEFILMIPKWGRNQYKLREWDIVDFYLPFRIGARQRFAVQGIVHEVQWNEETESQVSRIAFLKESSHPFNTYIHVKEDSVHIALEENEHPDDTFLKAIKDSFLIKRGIQVYFQHLIPFFSRATGYSAQDYPLVKTHILKDMANNVNNHVKQLETFYFRLVAEKDHYERLVEFLNPIELIDTIQSEINFDLLNLTFSNSPHRFYIEAIKELENTSYWNYNKIIMLLIKSLKSRSRWG